MESTRREELLRMLKQAEDYYWQQRTQGERLRVVLYGDIGTGKTRMAVVTSPKPVLVHSFDPGGTKLPEIQELAEKGLVFVDSRFENEDPAHPTAFKLWEHEFEKLRRAGAFELFGTYVLDSLTTWAEAMMNAILLRQAVKAAGSETRKRPKETGIGAIPEQQDYQIQIRTLVQYLHLFSTLPCHVVVTAHTDVVKDEGTGKLYIGPLITGKGKTKGPMLFDEVWVMKVKPSTSGGIYRVLTGPDGTHKARTRVGSGRFELEEVPDVRALLKKAGLPAEDKEPLPKRLVEEAEKGGGAGA